MSLSPSGISTISGIRFTPDACVVLIKTNWNHSITDALEAGALLKLQEAGVTIIQLSVPGAFELPFAVLHYWETHKYKACKPAAFIVLGCVIKGDTPHFDYVCKAVTDGVLQLNLKIPVPTIFGVLTVDNEEQAHERIGGKHGHKGEEAAATAIKMMAFVNKCKPMQPRS